VPDVYLIQEGYTAIPLQPGRTGVRSFCGDSRGVVCQTRRYAAPAWWAASASRAIRSADRMRATLGYFPPFIVYAPALAARSSASSTSAGLTFP
jgi:hypothetical protein